MIETVALTSKSFAAFGSVISAPLPPFQNVTPCPAPPNASYANQDTALKYANISTFASSYHLSSTNHPAHPTMSLFSCFPRPLRSKDGQQVFDLRILERHPFTTQTFIPLSSLMAQNTRAVIIVAPSLPSPVSPSDLTPYFPKQQQSGLPDLANVKAFVAEPGMGVTYAAGTWHAPMVVVGENRIDFVVSQWINERKDDDCQEVEIPDGVEIILRDNAAYGVRQSKL